MASRNWLTKPHTEKSWSARPHDELPILYLTVYGMTGVDDSNRIGRKAKEFSDEVRGPWFLLTDVRDFVIARPDGRDQWVENMRHAAHSGLAGWAIVSAIGVSTLQSRNVSIVSELSAITYFSTSLQDAEAWLVAAAAKRAG